MQGFLCEWEEAKVHFAHHVLYLFSEISIAEICHSTHIAVYFPKYFELVVTEFVQNVPFVFYVLSQLLLQGIFLLRGDGTQVAISIELFE
jgi:uncharacterized membrane protein YhdT